MVQQLYNLVQSFSDQSTTTSPGMKTSLLLLFTLASCQAAPLVEQALVTGFNITVEDVREGHDLKKRVEGHQKDEQDDEMNPNMEKTLEELNEELMQQIQLIQTMDKRFKDNQMSEEQMRQLEDKYFDNILDFLEAENYEQMLESVLESVVKSVVDPVVICPNLIYSNAQVSTCCQNNNCVVDCGDETKVNTHCFCSMFDNLYC